MKIQTPNELRKNAQNNVSKGMLTENYSINVDEVIQHLNAAFSTEIVCSFRYKDHYYKTKRLGIKDVADHFLSHAEQEQEHANLILDRIAQLKGTPDLNLSAIASNSHIEYVNCHSLCEMIEENLISERIAVNTYRDFIQYLSMKDPVTRIMIEKILATEEEHADDMLELKAQYCDNPSK